MTFGEWYWQGNFWLAVGLPIQVWLVSLGVPYWLVSLLYALLGVAVSLGLITVFVILAIWAERRFIARLRIGSGRTESGRSACSNRWPTRSSSWPKRSSCRPALTGSCTSWPRC